MPTDGIILVDKPQGPTSHDVVARARKAYGTRRVGHAGTLDPMATGVLVLGIGQATRLLGYLALDDKDYVATIRLGISTLSDDAQGEVTDRRGVGGVDEEAITRALRTQVGEIWQRPSAVSAIKVDGRRAHALIRAGEEVVLEPRRVIISDISVGTVHAGVDATGTTYLDAAVSVTCSSGTYIRAIARDLGDHLGTGGHVTALRRTRVGAFRSTDCVALDALPVDPLTPGAAAARAMPSRSVDAEHIHRIRHGVQIPVPWTRSPSGTVAVLDEAGDLVAIAEDGGELLRYRAVLVPATPDAG